jgi:hypothetical protein
MGKLKTRWLNQVLKTHREEYWQEIQQARLGRKKW